MARVLALNDLGQLTYCTCPPDKRGNGRCNHVMHQEEGESAQEFAKRASSRKFAKETDKENPAVDNDAIVKEWNQNALQEIRDILNEHGCCIVSQATGTGKSSIMSAIIDDHYEEQCVFFSPSIEINNSFEENNKNSRVMTLGNLNVLTYQKILNATKSKENFEKFCKRDGVSLPIKVLCLDEIHHLGENDLSEKNDKKWADAVSKILEWGTDENNLIVGASASVESGEEDSILNGKFKDKLSSNLSFEDAVRLGIIRMPNVITKPDYDQIRKLHENTKKVIASKGKYTGVYKPYIEDIESLIAESEKEFKERSEKAIKDKILENDNNGTSNKIIIFSQSTDKTLSDAEEYAKKIQEMFPERKIVSHNYHTGKSGKNNEDYFHRFCSGKFNNDEKDAINIISVYGCMNEGVHADASIMIQNRDTDSMILHDQQKGRILDIKSNTRGLVIDNSTTYYGNKFHNYENLSKEIGSEYSAKYIEDIIKLDYQRVKVHKDGTASKAAQKSFSTMKDFAKSDITLLHSKKTDIGNVKTEVHICNTTRDMFFPKKCKKEIAKFLSDNADENKNSSFIKNGIFDIVKKYPEYQEYLDIIGFGK